MTPTRWALSAPTGAALGEYREVMGRVDIITGTLGKALGGASGGTRQERSGGVAAPAFASVPVLQLAGAGDRRRVDQSAGTAGRGRRPARSLASGPTTASVPRKNDRRRLHIGRRRSRHHPVMLGEAKLAGNSPMRCSKEGIYVTGFFYPVVRKARRIRTQMSADHTRSKSNAQWRRLRIGRILALLHR